MKWNEAFYKDQYCKEFDTHVVSCEPCKNGYEVVLEDTIFYPEGGGQECDHGWLNDVCVLDVQRINDQVIHYVKEEVKGNVHCKIDWDRRFDFMQNHSGEHVVSGIIHTLFGYNNVGFRMGSDVVTIDFDGMIQEEDLNKIETMANEYVFKNQRLETMYLEGEDLNKLDYRSKLELDGVVRLVKIGDADLCACCGMHVLQCGEIGLIKLLNVHNHKDGVRIEMVCGKRALLYMQTIHDENLKISRMLKAKVFETSKFVNKLQKDCNMQLQTIKQLQEDLLQQSYKQVDMNEDVVVYCFEDMDRNALRKICNDTIDSKHACIVCGLIGNQVMIASSKVPLNKHKKEFEETLLFKGGGSDLMLQGKCDCNVDTIKLVLRRVSKQYE